MKAIDPRMIYINLYLCEPMFCTNERTLMNQYFLYVYSGHGSFRIGDTEYEAHCNDLFFCGKEVPNTITAAQKDPFILTGIDFDCDIDPKWYPPVINMTSNVGHEDLIREMIRSYNDPSGVSSQYCNALLKAFMLNITYFMQTDYCIPDETNRIMRYIKENRGVDTGVGDLERMQKSPSTSHNRRHRKERG